MNTCARFVTDGIRETLAHYRRDDLPLHRLSWEPHTRIDTLVPHAPSRWVEQLRDLQRRVAQVATTTEPVSAPALTESERHILEESLTMLADVLNLAHS
ncbi:hypothetical protein [Pseudonocardia spinosispora]|uniref:hypothetical protein n=1 Tax=Pseudonocardia spinosispora TaxID=103441 RepID=UPI00040E20E4|nr:hypothetical protein [Pseudonocardia spinosispora]